MASMLLAPHERADDAYPEGHEVTMETESTFKDENINPDDAAPPPDEPAGEGQGTRVVPSFLSRGPTTEAPASAPADEHSDSMSQFISRTMATTTETPQQRGRNRTSGQRVCELYGSLRCEWHHADGSYQPILFPSP